jgi:hypothetical protein
MIEENQKSPMPPQQPPAPDTEQRSAVIQKPKEIGGPKGPEPTRYGDWEKAGRCIDF